MTDSGNGPWMPEVFNYACGRSGVKYLWSIREQRDGTMNVKLNPKLHEFLDDVTDYVDSDGKSYTIWTWLRMSIWVTTRTKTSMRTEQYANMALARIGLPPQAELVRVLQGKLQSAREAGYGSYADELRRAFGGS